MYYEYLENTIGYNERRFNRLFETADRKKREQLEQDRIKFEKDAKDRTQAPPFSNNPERQKYGSDPDWGQQLFGAVGQAGMTAAAFAAAGLATSYSGNPLAGMATYQGLSALSRGIMGAQGMNRDVRTGAAAVQSVQDKITGYDGKVDPVNMAKRAVLGLQSTSTDGVTPRGVVDVFTDNQAAMNHVQQGQEGYQNYVRQQSAPYAVNAQQPQQAFQSYMRHAQPPAV